jgi:hypothetical protein
MTYSIPPIYLLVFWPPNLKYKTKLISVIGYEVRDGFGSDVRWDIDNELQLGLEINHK